MVLGVQIVGLLFGVCILYVSFLNYKKKEFTLNELGFWAIFAVGFGGVALFPGILDPIVESLSLGRTMDLFIILGFMFLVAAMFYTYRLMRRVQKSHEELVRKIALEKK